MTPRHRRGRRSRGPWGLRRRQRDGRVRRSAVGGGRGGRAALQHQLLLLLRMLLCLRSASGVMCTDKIRSACKTVHLR